MSMNAGSATVRILSLQNTQSIWLASAANVVLGEKHLRRVLKFYARYYNEMRTHRSRPVQRTDATCVCRKLRPCASCCWGTLK